MDTQSTHDGIDHNDQTSSLARLQQVLVLGGLALAMVWVWWVWPPSKTALLASLVLLTLGHAVILGIETVAAATINRTDSAPRASSAEWLGAWWQEVKVAPQVFAWRQPFRWRQLPDTSAALPASMPAVVLSLSTKAS